MLKACNEKARLLDEYTESVRLYEVAVRALSEARPQAILKDYLRMKEYSEQARKKTELARLVLEKHVSEHGC